MKTLLFSAKGRISRGSYLLGALALMVVAAVFTGATLAFQQAVTVPDDSGTMHMELWQLGIFAALAVAYLVFMVWSGICLAVKRFHDLDVPGSQIFMFLVPFLNVWCMIRLIFFAGTPGSNKYGANPASGPVGTVVPA